MRRKKAEQHDATPAEGGRITPAEVQNIEFRLAFRGYNERDVDAFLDRVTEDLSVYLEENQRLRSSGHEAPAAANESGSSSEDARREAEAIIARAREEAATIVRRAEEEATAVRAAGAVATGEIRNALGPFLGREREFLQSLGSLVQDHAEEIREMVMNLRSRVESSGGPPASEERPAGRGGAGATTGPSDRSPARPRRPTR